MYSRVPLLGLTEVSVRYHRHSRWAVDRVNLQLYAGEFIGLIGESGSGKTSLAHAILGLLPATSRLDGQLLYKQQCLTTLGQNELTRLRGAELGYVPQQSMAALNPVRTIGAQVAELYQLRCGLSRPEAWRRAADILEQMQLIDVPRVMKAYPHEISGGMAQRAVLAMAVSLKPSLLIADEPTTALDADLRASILVDIKRQQSDRRMAVLFISHDISLVARHADHLVVMYGGRVVESGSSDQVFTSPRHPYTRLLLELDIAEDEVAQQALTDICGCSFAPRCRHVRKQCCVAEPMWQGDSVRGWACCE